MQQNLLQFWVIHFFTCFTDQPIPNSVSMSWITEFWRCMHIFENGRCTFSLKHWRHDSFNLLIEHFLGIYHFDILIDDIIFYLSFICTNARCITCTGGGRNICPRSGWDIGCDAGASSSGKDMAGVCLFQNNLSFISFHYLGMVVSSNVNVCIFIFTIFSFI